MTSIIVSDVTGRNVDIFKRVRNLMVSGNGKIFRGV